MTAPMNQLTAATSLEQHAHYQLVARAITQLVEEQTNPPSLGDLARALGTSESHLQRVFSAWAGVSPKRFSQMLTRRYALQALREQRSVLDASMEAGLSSPGRLHDLLISCDAMTPGEIASGGRGMRLHSGWSESPFGRMFIAWCDRGICEISFHDDAAFESTKQQRVKEFEERWHGATHSGDDAAAQALAGRIFASPLERGKLHLLLRGTNFQVKVWEALMAIPAGDLVSYQQLATLAGQPSASRAVGSAMAKNTIAYLIPCHRVIRQSGDWGNYRWGMPRKLALHLWEQKS